MRIGVDARELGGRPTGAGRYLAGLLQQWAVDEQARPHEFLLYAQEPIALALDAHRFPTRDVRGPGGWRWEQLQLPRIAAGDHLDVWFAPAYTAPLRLRVPVVAAIHDISFVAHPEWFRVREGVRRRWLTQQTARDAAGIVTISEFSKREIIERLEVPESKIHVIPPGVGAAAARADPRAGPAAVGGLGGRTERPVPATLYVGSIFNRRHVPDLIRAFGSIARAFPDATLDIVGDNRSYPYEDVRRTIEAEGLQTIAQWHEYVPDDRLHELYAHARAFAFLSEYEGLGLTPLEALAAGVPPVLLDTPVARESCGEAALYVPPHNLPAVTEALRTVLFDESTRARLLTAAPAALAKYSWPRAARETLAVIQQACAGKSATAEATETNGGHGLFG
jgi:glycosyltransferase involved in cell wall biosynthesis